MKIHNAIALASTELMIKDLQIIHVQNNKKETAIPYI